MLRGRNPRAKPPEYRQVRRLARELAESLAPGKRASVLLCGSWARGVAHQASDVDLWVIGRRDRTVVLEREGRLVSVKYLPAALARREMRDPARWDGAIPGWRTARILRDPAGVASRLRSQARRFRWSTVRGIRDAYVANELAGWAEEVAKLLRALETGERETASVQRNLIANKMAVLRALELEVLWETENGLWELVARRSGAAFRTAQRAALGTDGGSWEDSCEGALRLYSLTARASRGVLRGEKRRIVVAACRRAGYPIEGKGSRRR